MHIGTKLLALAAAGSVTLAGAASASAAIDLPVRQAAVVAENEGLVGSGLGFIIAALVAAGVVYVIVDDDEDEPQSP